MAQKQPSDWWRINATSRLIGQLRGITIVETGGWFDVYIGEKHFTGTTRLNEAMKYLGFG